ncbi:MAG: hypothetical protein R3D26_15380 [Cyanobacteriota/Melainabacteria group bacterium]
MLPVEGSIFDLVRDPELHKDHQCHGKAVTYITGLGNRVASGTI